MQANGPRVLLTMTYYHLNNKTFVTTGNEKGLSSTETKFHYQQHNDLITATYSGGQIREGQVVGRQTSPNEIELLFQCVTLANELKAGQSKGKIAEDADGKLLLSFEWHWLNGDQSGGMSYYKEV